LFPLFANINSTSDTGGKFTGVVDSGGKMTLMLFSGLGGRFMKKT
jgi:hypothetical protein